MKGKIHILIALAAVLAVSCARDKGNYSYHDVNEALIDEKGFADTAYNIRLGIDRLEVTPKIDFTLDPNGSRAYTYEWVAVGQKQLKGQRFVLGSDRNLDIDPNTEPKLTAEDYILYFKVTDPQTDLVFTQSTELNVRGLYTRGWMLGGEDGNGNGRVDMLSISGDTLTLKNITDLADGITLNPVTLVWVDNHEYPADPRVMIATTEGSYMAGREDFKISETSNLIYSFTTDEFLDKMRVTDYQRINDKRLIAVVDDYPYEVRSVSDGLIGNPVSHYQNDLTGIFKVAPRYACNHKQVDVRRFVFFHTADRLFCDIPNMHSYLEKLIDGEGDPFSWNTYNDFPDTGLAFVHTINSFFTSGQSATVLRHEPTGKLYIYTYTVERASLVNVTKGNRYEVAGAPGLDETKLMGMTTNNGYLLYAHGNKLYGYDFRRGIPAVVLDQFDGEITLLHNDTFTSEKHDDCFYLATFREGNPDSGTLYKYQVSDDPDRITVTRKHSWTGLARIVSMYFKEY